MKGILGSNSFWKFQGKNIFWRIFVRQPDLKEMYRESNLQKKGKGTLLLFKRLMMKILKN